MRVIYSARDELQARISVAVRITTAGITLTRRRLEHLALSDADLDRLPEIIAAPRAVLYDRDVAAPTLLYVFDPVPENQKLGKVVVRVNYEKRLRIDGAARQTVTSHSVRTAGYVTLANLREARYELIDGELEK